MRPLLSLCIGLGVSSATLAQQRVVHEARFVVQAPGIVLSKVDPAGPPRWESMPIAFRRFNEALVSWNAELPAEGGISFEIRVGKSSESFWSPYLYVGDWGSVPQEYSRIRSFPEGKIDVDYFSSSKSFDRIQIRVTRFDPPNLPSASLVRVQQLAVCASNTLGDHEPEEDFVGCGGSEGISFAHEIYRRLRVPPRSQKSESPELAARVCSPTSVAMVLDARGVCVSTQEVAKRLYDKEHDIYGNWTRAVQGAFSFGVPGYLTRFSNWWAVEKMIAEGTPVIASIKVDPGELSGAPYESTKGHLLVIVGFKPPRGSEEPEVEVNDPAAPTIAGVRRSYRRRDLEKVWMQNAKGTAYVLQPAPSSLVELRKYSHEVSFAFSYATEANFTKRRLYGSEGCFLRKSALDRLLRVRDRLKPQGLRIKVLDAYRPLSVQKKMWEILPDERYVANPAKGSRHNRGAAVDVTLIDKDGKELEMPSAFDHFGPESHRDYQGGSEQARKNRKILQDAMEAEGFVGLPTEWWHFDDPEWEKYPILDIPLEELP